MSATQNHGAISGDIGLPGPPLRPRPMSFHAAAVDDVSGDAPRSYGPVHSAGVRGEFTILTQNIFRGTAQAVAVPEERDELERDRTPRRDVEKADNIVDTEIHNTPGAIAGSANADVIEGTTLVFDSMPPLPPPRLPPPGTAAQSPTKQDLKDETAFLRNQL